MGYGFSLAASHILAAPALPCVGWHINIELPYWTGTASQKRLIFIKRDNRKRSPDKLKQLTFEHMGWREKYLLGVRFKEPGSEDNIGNSTHSYYPFKHNTLLEFPWVAVQFTEQGCIGFWRNWLCCFARPLEPERTILKSGISCS